MKERYCNKCGKPLTTENWYPSFRAKGSYKCKRCERERRADYESGLRVKYENIMGNKCILCGSTKNLDGHHNDEFLPKGYRGNKRTIFWLLAHHEETKLLCGSCNLKLHSAYGYHLPTKEGKLARFSDYVYDGDHDRASMILRAMAVGLLTKSAFVKSVSKWIALLDLMTFKIFFKYIPNFFVTHEMVADSLRRLHLMDNLYGSPHFEGLSELERAAGICGELIFHHWRFLTGRVSGDWQTIPEPKYVEGGDVDFVINGEECDIKTAVMTYAGVYTKDYKSRAYSKKFPIYIFVRMYESRAYILGFARREELDEYNETRVHLLHPIEDLFKKPIDTSRTLRDLLSASERDRLDEILARA